MATLARHPRRNTVSAVHQNAVLRIQRSTWPRSKARKGTGVRYGGRRRTLQEEQDVKRARRETSPAYAVTNVVASKRSGEGMRAWSSPEHGDSSLRDAWRAAGAWVVPFWKWKSAQSREGDSGRVCSFPPAITSGRRVPPSDRALWCWDVFTGCNGVFRCLSFQGFEAWSLC